MLDCRSLEAPDKEVCDDTDNDCDGTVDETPGDVGDPCATGLPGECALGATVCSDGLVQCEGQISYDGIMRYP